MLQRFFSGIRKRPAHERRILGVAAYLAIAAIIFAGWVKSIPGMLNTGTLEAHTQAIAGSDSPNTSGQASLVSPFAALKQSMQDLGKGITELKQSYQNGVNGASTSDVSAGAGVNTDGSQEYAPRSTPADSPNLPANASASGEISSHILGSPSATAPSTEQKMSFWASIQSAAGGFVQSIIDSVRALGR